MIAKQVPCRSRHGDSCCQQVRLEFTQALLAASVGVCDQRVDENTSRHRVFQSSLDFLPVKTKDSDFHALFGAVDPFDQWGHAVTRLDQQFHWHSPVVLRRPALS